MTNPTESPINVSTKELPAPKFGKPDKDGNRWATQTLGDDTVKVYVITKEGRQLNNTEVDEATAKKNILAYLSL